MALQQSCRNKYRPFYSCVLSCSLLFLCKFLLISIKTASLVKEKQRVSIKTRSTPASLSFKDRASKHKTVKRYIALVCGHDLAAAGYVYDLPRNSAEVCGWRDGISKRGFECSFVVLCIVLRTIRKTQYHMCHSNHSASQSVFVRENNPTR